MPLSNGVAAARQSLSGIVPSLSVQPLVENAIRHGVERRAGSGLDATLSVSERAAVLDELGRLVTDERADDGSLRLPRAMTLVTATV